MSQNTKGRKISRIAAVALILALIVSVGAVVMSASAASGVFNVSVYDNVHTNGAVEKTQGGAVVAVDGEANFSNDGSVNLKTDQIFTTTREGLNNVKRLELTVTDKSSSVTVNVSKSGSTKWTAASGNTTSSSTYYYLSSFGLDKTTFDNLMNGISISCSKSSSTASAAVKLTLKAGSSYTTSKVSDTNQLGRSNGTATTYTEVVNFFTYATGEIVPNSARMEFKNKEGDDRNENPDPSGGGTAYFDMYVTNVGNSSLLRLGYQIKEANQTWDTSTQTLYAIGDDTYLFSKDGKDGESYDELGKVSSSTGAVTNPKTFTIKVDKILSGNKTQGLDPEKDYDIRGVVVTNSDTAAYTKAVTVPRVKYVQPVITSLNIGNTSAQQQGVKKTITATIEFNNRNYDNDGGPRLKMQLFFTQNRSTSADKKDESTWTPVNDGLITTLAKNPDGTYKTSYAYETEHTLPVGDSSACAYKLVVTDVNADGDYTGDGGYSVTKYSDYQFVLDNSAPDAPQISAVGLPNADLDNGAVVGGANSSVKLRISGSSDHGGSGVKEYSYEMYYLGTDDITAFGNEHPGQNINENSSNADILRVMKTLSGEDPGKVYEYTPASSLELKSDDPNEADETKKYAELSIAKDGFYCVHATATDNVGKTSDSTMAVFRVDLTPPNAPVIAMVKQKAGGSIESVGGALTTGNFEEYDDRTYSGDVVWVLVRTDAGAGKEVDVSKYQYSVNGGLNWRNIDSAVNFDGKKAYSLVGASMNVFNKNKNYARESFTYDAAFQLSNKEINGYQTVIVRATDKLGNTSLPSDSLIMRTTEAIKAKGSIQHEGIEIAMALGNTTLEMTASIEPDLRNDVALKINEKYFGTNHSYNDKTNPISQLYELVNGSYQIHQCTWETSGSNTVCDKGDKCPYRLDSRFYTPSMVNMQGLDSGDSEADTNFDWVHFDHTNYIKEDVSGKGTVYFPTVVFDAGKASASAAPEGTTYDALHTTANTNIDKTKSTYQTEKGETRYTAMTDYVVYTGQREPIANGTGADNSTKEPGAANRDKNVALLKDPGALAKATVTLTGNNSHYFNETYNANGLHLGNDTYAQMGRYAAGSATGATTGVSNIVGRVYHIVDMSEDPQHKLGEITKTKYKTVKQDKIDPGTGQPETDEEGNVIQEDVTVEDYHYDIPVTSKDREGTWSTIYTLGYYYTSSRDWIFNYNGQSTRKEIFFSIDSTKLGTHSNDGYGFLFNTTIRQNTEGEWVISGYLLGLGNPQANDAAASTYKKFIFYLEDVRLDWFANSRVSTQGLYNNATGDDFFRVWTLALMNQTNPTGGTVTANDDGSRTLTFGEQKITLLARNLDTTATYNNFCFVTDGASAELYLWVSSSAQTQAQVINEFDNGKGFSRISWKQADGTTAYENNNPSASAPGKDADASYVLYVPRPKVDNTSVGDLSKFEDTDDPTKSPHSDSNCYGFGPISFARATNHGCARDSLVVFSNVTLRVTKGKSLSEVITQPRWGTGKVKFILNVSDDSIQDLTDPIMSANVTWRIQTDSAKLISWGSLINRATTVDFIRNKIENNGTYIVSRVTSYDDMDVTDNEGKVIKKDAPGQRSQSEAVAEYIADTYYKSYGLNLDGGKLAPNEFDKLLENKGRVYSLENAKQMTFSVEVESNNETGAKQDYNEGTANEDFPSGRWYISYDATGYGGRKSYARFSDALNLKVTEPGRYQVYFAPDLSRLGDKKDDPTDDTLDPTAQNCIFDFIVSEDAYAQPVATVDASNNITVYDFSLDPDNNIVVTQTPDYDKVNTTQQLTGITETVWRWELSAPFVDPDTKEQSSIILMKSGETTVKRSSTPAMKSPYDGKTIEQLTKAVGTLYTEGTYKAADYIKRLQENGDNSLNYKTGTGTDNGKIYYSSVPTGATITVYERVKEISTRRILNASGKAAYVEAPFNGTTLSPEKSTNLVNAAGTNVKPIRPASSVMLSKTIMYDTAEDSDTLTVSRNSFHGQKEQLNLGWQVIVPGYVDPIPLEDNETNGETWSTPAKGTVLNSLTNAKWNGEKFTVMTVTTENGKKNSPAFDDKTGRTSGEWTITKKAISDLAGKNGGSFTLKIIETVNKKPTGTGGTWSDGTTELVSDSSARTIYYSRDTLPPSMQTVTLMTGTRKADSTGAAKYDDNLFDWADYEASNYLDMTTEAGKMGEKVIKVTVGGATDNEGAVEGYAYAFYDYAPGSTDLSTATYYWMDDTGAFHTAQQVGERYPVQQAIERIVDKDTGKVTHGNGILSDPTMDVEGKEFSFIINQNAMYVDGKLREPTALLNLGVFAFDNQKFNEEPSAGATFAITGANETARTKVENIKLARFTPMPVAVTAVNTTGETVATIGNDHGFTDVAGTDSVVTSLVANTKVTISFAPRQDWFPVGKTSKDDRVKNAEQIKDLDEHPSDLFVKYFTDRSGAADLTNKVTIKYKVERRAPDDTGFKVVTDPSAGVLDKENQLYTSTVSVSESGDYRVIVSARNGSGAYSEERVLTFTIDRDPPTSPTVTVFDPQGAVYKENEWVQAARVTAFGASDRDANWYYKYSIDNGATWTDTRETGTYNAPVEFWIRETGTHYVRVKAVDSGGNETEAPMVKVMVDATPPKVSAPTMKADSQSVSVFEQCIISIGQTDGGMVYSLKNGEPDLVNQQVILDPGQTANFVIVPDEGKSIYSIKIGDVAYSTENLTKFNQKVDGKDAWLLTVPDVNDDGVLKVVFEDAAATAGYMSNARVASNNALVALREVLPETYAGNDVPVPIAVGDTYSVTIWDENPDATRTTATPARDIPYGSDVTLKISLLDDTYRVTGLEITGTIGAGKDVTVGAADLKEVNGVIEYKLENVMSDLDVVVKVEEKIPTTVTLDVDGNGEIFLNDILPSITNDTYEYETYVGEQIELEVVPMTDYKLGSLKKFNGASDQVGEELSNGSNQYTLTVTEDMRLTAEFVVDTNKAQASGVTVVIQQSNGGLHGTVSPRGTVSGGSGEPESHVIQAVNGGDLTVVLKPNPGYQASDVTYTVNGTENDVAVTTDSDTGYSTVTLPGVKGAADRNVLRVTFTGKQHTISTKAVTVLAAGQKPTATDPEGGGQISLTIKGKPFSTETVQEGEDVEVTITPDAGYRIENVYDNGTERGQVSRLTLTGVRRDHEIIATFVKRTFGAAKTSHTMTVTAVGISDGQEALHKEAYSFRLDDGTWSDYQSGTSITYSNLKPNREYTATVRARDKQGNESSAVAVFEAKDGVDANSNKAYTLANMPIALSVEAADDTDNVLDKTVKVSVDSMGNPADTEYCVYYSEYDNMRYRTLATVRSKNAQVENPEDMYWSTLDAFGQITVYGLSPGTKYFLQVVARNHDKIPTGENDQNILEITLSPTAPPENTFYFEEQEAPGAGIKLHWDDPIGDVNGFEIYRDGTLIMEIEKDKRDWEDPYTSLRGDGVYVYSYAYQNDAGSGARRTAVSEEYYEKAKAVSLAKAEEVPDQSKIAAAEAELKKLNDLMQGDEHPNLYRELMTYPIFPAYYTKVSAAPTSVTDYSGRMVLRILPESSAAARAQKFTVGLHAYDEHGNLVPEGTSYGTIVTSDGSQELKWNTAATERETTCTNSSGATVSWTNLNINWDYRVYVKSVSSTGATEKDGNGNVTNGYQSGMTITPEVALGKKYVVDYNGYGYTYTNSNAKTLLGEPQTSWNTTNSSDAYTKKANDTYTGWSTTKVVPGDGIELRNSAAVTEEDNKIKFNKSPQVFIQKSGSSYDIDELYGTANGDNTEVNAYNNRYIVAEQGDEDMIVKLHVKVYDPDGPDGSNLNYTVTGTLGGVTAKTVIQPKVADTPAVGADAEHATDCVLEFDVKNLATGVYNDLTLSVANGAISVDSEEIPKGTVKLVVNQSLPTINATNGGGTKKIEDKRFYGEYITEASDTKKVSTVVVTTNVSSNNMADLRKVRMILMKDQYAGAEFNGLFDKVMAGTSSAVENAKIDAVAPPKISYFQVSPDDYAEAAELPAVKADPSLAIATEPVAGTTYYWVEKNIALDNGWCQFLTRNANEYTAHLYENDPSGTTYPVLVVAKFGKNETTMNLRFQVMEAPTLKVETQQTWSWVQTTSEEYDVYQSKARDNGGKWTIGDVYKAAQDGNALNKDTKAPNEMDPPFSHALPAMEIRNEGQPNQSYWVFKLWDSKATIQSMEVSSYLQVKTGMYSRIEQAQIVMVPGTMEDPSDPVTGAPPSLSTGVIKGANAKFQGENPLYDNIRATFRVAGLSPNTTYYMWVYYQVKDPEKDPDAPDALVWYHNDVQDMIAMTTEGDYHVSTIGFQEPRVSFEEGVLSTSGVTTAATLTRLGDYTYSGVRVAITAEYYEADQYGEYLNVDQTTGEPIPIDSGSEQYKWAQDTVKLITQEQTIAGSISSGGVSYQVKNNDKQQGHLIVRLIVRVVENLAAGARTGINRETTNADIFEIFVLDDESPVTTYELGLDDLAGLAYVENGDKAHMEEAHYDYKFGGLPYPYGTADIAGLSLSVKNIGSGELNNITAVLYNKNRTKSSDDPAAVNDIDFAFATPLTSTSLASPDEGPLAASERSLLKIVPKDGLADGVHEGWLRLTADFVNEKEHPENVVWVHLYQVVGQATLRGNIFIGEEKPETTSEFVGYATVKIYSSSTSSGDRGEPLYQTQTDKNGYYEIPNILENQRYCIVVERSGCVTFDGLEKRLAWEPTKENERSDYQFDLHMITGDVDGNGRVDADDKAMMETYMNHTLAEAEASRKEALEAGDEALAAKFAKYVEDIKKCDLDQNGGVNSIDLMLLSNNLNRGTTVGGVFVPLYGVDMPKRAVG